MTNPTENSKQTLERFLTHLGKPVSQEQLERGSSNVLDRLRAEDVRVDVRVPLRVTTMPTAARPVRTPVWSTIAAVAALMLTGALLHMALVKLSAPNTIASSVRGDVTFVADGRDAAHSQVESGRVLRAGENGGVLTLPDGSHVDMSPSAELSVVRVLGDLRVRLTSGTVLITAAKQKEGHHLYVETKDCVISVIGTVFQVNAEKTGSRISVIEGEVHVQRGEISQTLVAGQQASTSPELGPLVQEVPAAVLVAQQNVPTPPVPPALPAAEAPKPFEDIVWVAAPPVQNGNGTVRGTVRNGTGDGIPDVTVTLCPTGTRVTSHFAPAEQTPNDLVVRNKTYFFAVWDSARCQQNGVKTDSMGRFEFRNVGAGTYLVSADREGYTSGRYNPSPDGQRIFRNFNFTLGHTYTINEGMQRGFSAYTRAALFKGDQTAITLGSNDSVAEVSLTLVRGSLSGHVRDADGRPVLNAVVRIVARSAGAATDGQTMAVTLTNDQGEYKVYGLPTGEYRVGVTVPSGLPGSEIWFSRNPNPGGITGLTVSEGEEITNIDMVVPRR